MQGGKVTLGMEEKLRWYFSAALLIGYVVIFWLWMGADRSFVVISGLLWGLVFGLWLLISWKQGYFVDRLDQVGHWVVVLDVFLEAILIARHDHFGFLICAVAFGAVIGGYRLHVGSRVEGR